MSINARPRDRPPSLPLQPEPTAIFIAKDHHAGGCTTALVRMWLNGDTEHCRLCPLGRCTAYAGVCLVQVRMDVPEDQARMFSTTGLRWAPDGSPGGIFLRHDYPRLVDLDSVMVVDAAREALQEHLAEPTGWHSA